MSHGSGYVKGCQCERCEAYRQRSRERSRANPDKNNPARRRYKTEKQREYNDVNRDQVNAKARERYALYREENPLPPRPRRTPAPPKPSTRHGGPDEYARMYGDQDGLCYLCLRPLPDDRRAVHVDHDHTCCDPGPRGRDTDSCRYCRRGLTHERCNQIWGLAKEDGELLRIMAREGERVRDETRQRIAAKSYVQDALL